MLENRLAIPTSVACRAPRAPICAPSGHRGILIWEVASASGFTARIESSLAGDRVFLSFLELAIGIAAMIASAALCPDKPRMIGRRLGMMLRVPLLHERHRHNRRERRLSESASINIDGIVDASAIYLHGVSVKGATHNVFFVTTTYGKTIAVDADQGTILWEYTPPKFDSWAGTRQITNTTPSTKTLTARIFIRSPA